MANTTWAAATGVTLSGGNLTVAATSSSAANVFSADKYLTGKYYFEYTVGQWAGSSTGVGIAVAGASGRTNSCVLNPSGTIFTNNVGGTTGALGGLGTAGTVIGVAMDADNSAVWFRSGASGNWNGSATANPATNTGGQSLSSIRGVASLYAFFTPSATNDRITLNSGDTAFTGTAPSGFTSGLPTNTNVTLAAVTQVAVEEWADSNPDARITQLAVEQWSSSFATSGNAIVTQVAVEEWAVYTAVSAGRKRRLAMIV